MKLGTTEKFWIVTDAGPHDTLADCCFETSLKGLEDQFRGGFTCEGSPILFTEREEAEAEAGRRLVARDAGRVLAGGIPTFEGADRVQVLDASGNVLFTAPIPKVRR